MNNNMNNFNNMNNMNNMNNNMMNLNNNSNNTANEEVVTPKNKNIKLGMYKNENDMSNIVFKRVMYLIIFILLVIIVVLVMKKRPSTVNCPCDNEMFTSKLEVAETLNKELGLEMYYKARDVYGDFALDTSRICGAMSNTTLVDNYFMRSESPKFTTYTELANYVRSYFYGSPASVLLSSNKFKNYGGKLYCVKESRVKNVKYIGLDNIVLEDVSANKLTFKVKEKYFGETESIDCLENCVYDYKENVFIIEKKDDRWLVSDFTLPY